MIRRIKLGIGLSANSENEKLKMWHREGLMHFFCGMYHMTSSHKIWSDSNHNNRQYISRATSVQCTVAASDHFLCVKMMPYY